MLDVGFAGEFRIVVSDKDGNIKQDTGYQKNLILNQGLDFFGGDKGTYINSYCVIGSGNSTPAVTQTQLDAAVAIATGTNITSDYSYVDKGDNLYRMWEQKQYRFEGLNNINISEVGLTSARVAGTLAPIVTDYWLNTRALIKDSSGRPTTITVKTGEVLDIYYKIHKVIDTRDKTFVVNMLDGDGDTVPYNVTIRPSYLGHSHYNSISGRVSIYRASTGSLASVLHITNKQLGSNLGYTTGEYSKSLYDSEYRGTFPELKPYVPSSFKSTLTLFFNLNNANNAIINTISFEGKSNNYIFSFLPFQVRFGSVADDSPIPKTANHTLELPFEVSWGRYEGAL